MGSIRSPQERGLAVIKESMNSPEELQRLETRRKQRLWERRYRGGRRTRRVWAHQREEKKF